MASRSAIVAILCLALTGSLGAGAASGRQIGSGPTAEDGPCFYEGDPVDDDGHLIKPPELVEIEARVVATPDDPEIRRQLVDATYRLAEGVLYSSCAPTRVRYELARALLGLVLELDVGHRGARISMRDVRSKMRAFRRVDAERGRRAATPVAEEPFPPDRR